KGTSYRMGTGGTFSGDATPGSRTTVQKKYPANIDRDWRFVGVVLANESLTLSAVLQGNEAAMNWVIVTSNPIDHFEVERSTDNIRFTRVSTVNQRVVSTQAQAFTAKDNVSNVYEEVLYYRVKAVTATGEYTYSNIVALRKSRMNIPLTLMPNPAGAEIAMSFSADNAGEVTIRMIDANGRVVHTQKQQVAKGTNVIRLSNLSRFGNGTYTMQVQVNNRMLSQKFILFN
ncbi:MAG TPA: T9SS type A sorting domain-containing protein, partial [Ferruginibacter sp.]|nr:T9SS type A sorting domain-containing protein [Ferruginibacter sp.]